MGRGPDAGTSTPMTFSGRCKDLQNGKESTFINIQTCTPERKDSDSSRNGMAKEKTEKTSKNTRGFSSGFYARFKGVSREPVKEEKPREPPPGHLSNGRGITNEGKREKHCSRRGHDFRGKKGVGKVRGLPGEKAPK